MDKLPQFGQELADAQAQLDDVLARCAIRLKAFDNIVPANDNLLFPGVSAPASESLSREIAARSQELAGP